MTLGSAEQLSHSDGKLHSISKTINVHRMKFSQRKKIYLKKLPSSPLPMVPGPIYVTFIFVM
jgi:hypothetical protein